MTAIGIGVQVAALTIAVLGTWAQPPADQPKPPDPAHHLDDVQRKLKATKAVNVTAERALSYGRAFLISGQDAMRAGRTFQADRLIAAADATIHIAEHQQHLQSGGGPKGPPPATTLPERLQRTYFQVQQADYFLEQARDTRARSFPKWARDFYQIAVRSSERNDTVAADENAKCAEEVVRALESLAQAASASVSAPAGRPAAPAPGGAPRLR